jgi:TRAP-type C4-dicarboxylate transport system substrate-binding protein
MTYPLSFIAILGACLVLSAVSGPKALAGAITLKMAHQWPDDPNDYVVSTGKKFAAEVDARSGGSIHINIFPADSLVKALDTRAVQRSL